MSRVGAHTQRCVLLTTGEILCTRLPSVVLYASIKQTSTGKDAASCQDGEGDKHRVTHQLRLHRQSAHGLESNAAM